MKKILLIFSLFLVLAVPMRAQVFIMEENENEFRNVFGNGEWNNVIYHGSGDDQANFVPIGNGLLIMTAFGACYLMKKRKKTNNKFNL